MRSIGTLFPRLKLENGDVLYYLGEKRTLTVIREQRSRAKVKCIMDRLILWVPYEADYAYKQQQIEKWYRKEAAEILTQKVQEYAEILNVNFKDIRIKDQKSRWGSCSSKGNLNFNWRIIMAPEPVCDYVIIHELCHLIHMDHSPDFWKKVEEICPEYRQYKKWLKNNIELLYIF
ncbi:MAG: M48 family metallopeptidase [Lachnospiraceae bacterium]|nr:M48 family metallopeptidase [Lachnospiraceae bacterium]